MRIAIDTGGTFTDCVARIDGSLHVLKLRSTPQDPGLAVLEGVRLLSGGRPADVRHGTTVGTNAMLERKGARVAFVTTAGFEDTIAIGRQTRPQLYMLNPAPIACLVEPALRFGLRERVSSEAAVLQEPTDDELAALAEAVRDSGAESIAISLLFSFLHPEHERRVAAALEPLGLPISVSHQILPEFREYERASTLVVNAYLAPKMQQYLLSLDHSVAEMFRAETGQSSVQVMQSSGGIVGARVAAAEPVRTVLSGPAGGVMGAWAMAQAAGIDRILGFDMGGTSTDVFLADAASGGPALTGESIVAGVPVSVPMLDIHTAGAGGGSLTRFDAGGLLRVGPESAGSVPGPICFGRGEQPTVTDANLLLGRLDSSQFMGGTVALDVERTRAIFAAQRGPLASVEAYAQGILRVVETQMERAIRVISVERGHDPRRFTLVAFGGGGPLHACAVARALQVPRVMIPAHPGALSAVGILLADAVRDSSRTVMLRSDEVARLDSIFAELEQESGTRGADAKVVFERSLDLRYKGQGYELNVAYGDDVFERFHAQHEQRYGFANRSRPIEIVNVRLRARTPSEPYLTEVQPLIAGDGAHAQRGTQSVYFDGVWHEARVYDRDRLRPGDQLHGSALIAEYTSATVLPPGAQLAVDGLGNLLIDVNAGALASAGVTGREEVLR